MVEFEERFKVVALVSASARDLTRRVSSAFFASGDVFSDVIGDFASVKSAVNQSHSPQTSQL